MHSNAQRRSAAAFEFVASWPSCLLSVGVAMHPHARPRRPAGLSKTSLMIQSLLLFIQQRRHNKQRTFFFYWCCRLLSRRSSIACCSGRDVVETCGKHLYHTAPARPSAGNNGRTSIRGRVVSLCRPHCRPQLQQQQLLVVSISCF